MTGNSFVAEAMKLEDEELLFRLDSIRERERGELARFLAALGEVDRRHLIERKAFPSAYTYCVRKLRLSEDEACRRVRAATACRKFNFILSHIADGSLTLTGLALLANILTPENVRSVIRRACGKTTREVARIVVEIAPRPEPTDSIRSAAPASESNPTAAPQGLSIGRPAGWDRVQACSADRDSYSFAAPTNLRAAVQRIKEIIWHQDPRARLGDILLRVCLFWLEHNDPQVKLAKNGPRAKKRDSKPGARAIPEWVQDEVRKRDGGRCAFEAEGKRCGETSGLEFDHIVPFAIGGPSDDPANIREVCPNHNQYLARLAFGEKVDRRKQDGLDRLPP